MPRPFLALITPLSGDEHPEHPIVYPPPLDPNPPHPAHPIVIPPDAIAPGVPTHPIYIPVYPAHPIVIPPGAIDPGPPPRPEHPIVLPPPYPAHPIVIPPGSVAPGVPTHPIYLPPVIWGPGDPRPNPPIYDVPAGVAWYGVTPQGQLYGPFYANPAGGPAPGAPGNFPPAVQPVRK